MTNHIDMIVQLWNALCYFFFIIIIIIITINIIIIIGFPDQIRKFDNQIHFNIIQIRQILSCRENYHSNSFS